MYPIQPVVTFSTPVIPFRCALNKRGRAEYGSIDELIENCEANISTVGTNNGNVFMPDVRISTHYSTYLDFRPFVTNYDSCLKGLVPYEKRKYVKWVHRSQPFDIIKYTAGGHFKTHYDEKMTESHYGTLLIFPPASGKYAHTGGKLIITPGGGQEFIFNSSQNLRWTFIAFRTGIPHTCEKVTSGTRIVLKTELHYADERARSPIPVRPHEMILDRSRPIYENTNLDPHEQSTDVINFGS